MYRYRARDLEETEILLDLAPCENLVRRHAPRRKLRKRGFGCERETYRGREQLLRNDYSLRRRQDRRDAGRPATHWLRRTICCDMKRVYATWMLGQLAGMWLIPTAAHGQVVDSSGVRPTWLAPLILVGSAFEDRLRVDQILGRAATAGWLMRSTSTLTPPLAGDSGVRWAIATPLVDAVWNSELPFSLNDGALWAGRGLSTRITVGVRAQFRNVSLTIAPEIVTAENGDFWVLPGAEPSRSPYASPWRTTAQSADLPLRFGNQSFMMLSPGQSTLAVRLRRIVVGASTEDEWWGPGIRNALLLSNNAQGFPHLFLRTATPLRTRVGDVEAKWLVGGLTESLYFDRDSSNDVRSLSALAVTLQPAAARGLTLGLARGVYRGAGSIGTILPAGFFDVLTYWGRADEPLKERERPREQLLSLFSRWVFPASGAEVYGEWARVILPKSLRELLVAPQRTQGYTLGLQWARTVRSAARVRAQIEATMLEQTPRERGGVVPSFYVSGLIPQGYTQRGQVIGASIGPGSSSQWLAVDYDARRWRLGLVAGRIRWEDEAYYRQPTGLSFHSHDVSVFGGVRLGGTLLGNDIGAEVLTGTRYNYLFQNPTGPDIANPTFDVRNVTLKLSMSPGIRQERSANRSPGS
jgi:hypothetical protein